MPNVTATPRGNSNGEAIIEFLDTVGTTPITYTFQTTQEKLKIKNNGYGTLQVTVNGAASTLSPSKSKEFYGNINSFVIGSSGGGVQSFEVVASNYTANEASSKNAKIPLKMPTPDGLVSVAHPDVVYVSEGWMGYKYWMAFTPYPSAVREHPNIVASNNGIDWEVPNGVINPVAPLIESKADGFASQSDNDLVLGSDGIMRLYYRSMDGAANEGVYLRTSSNGRTWSSRNLLFTNPSGYKILSPAIVQKDDGSFVMFSINDTAARAVRLERRTSADGINWSNPEICVIPTANYDTWHLDVVYHQGVFHALVTSRSPYRLYYYSSKDGLNFTQTVSDPIIHLSGYDFDKDGHYRSTLVPVPGEPLLWDVWVTGIQTNAAGSMWADDAIWSFGLFRNVNLKTGTMEYALNSKISKADDSLIWLPSQKFKIVSAATDLVQNQKYPHYNFPKSVQSRIAATVIFPKYWTQVRSSILWYNKGVTAGNVRFQLLREELTVNSNITTGSPIGDSFTATAKAQNLLSITTLTPDRAINPGLMTSIVVDRLGTVTAEDTLLEDIGFLGISFERIG